MTQAVTVRKIPRELGRLLRKKAAEEGTSINKTVIRMLEERAGLAGRRGKAHPRENALHHDLDTLAGSWTKEEAAAFDQLLRAQRAVEPDMWK